MARSLTDLLRDVRSCRICEEHLVDGVRPIVQVASKAKIVIIGQAPGRKVHESGVPWDDPSGVRLRSWLGLTTEQFYDPNNVAIIPMGFCYPGRGNGGDLPPRPECADTWREALLSQLPNIELTLCIGRYAIDWHLRPPTRATLTDVVADWERYWPQQLPQPHPSPRNTKWLRDRPWVEEEIVPVLQSHIRALLSQAPRT